MLDGAALGDAIRGAVDAAVAGGSVDRVAMFRAMGVAIVTYLQANAMVSVSVTVSSVSGVTPGAGVSGPGIGTGTGTLS